MTKKRVAKCGRMVTIQGTRGKCVKPKGHSGIHWHWMWH